MAKGMVRVPVREQDPKERATNFEEVCLGYNQEEAMEEAPDVSIVKMRNVSKDARYPSIFRHSFRK